MNFSTKFICPSGITRESFPNMVSSNQVLVWLNSSSSSFFFTLFRVSTWVFFFSVFVPFTCHFAWLKVSFAWNRRVLKSPCRISSHCYFARPSGRCQWFWWLDQSNLATSQKYESYDHTMEDARLAIIPMMSTTLFGSRIFSFRM